MSKLGKIVAWGQAELHKLFHTLPEVVKKYGTEALHITNVIKTALASPTAAAIEAALSQMIPGSWETSIIAHISKGIAIAVPGITNILAHGDLPPADQAKALIAYLQTLSPKMQNAGLLKLLSGILMSLDPHLTEVGADTAAQVIYAKSVQEATADTVSATKQH